MSTHKSQTCQRDPASLEVNISCEYICKNKFDHRMNENKHTNNHINRINELTPNIYTFVYVYLCGSVRNNKRNSTRMSIQCFLDERKHRRFFYIRFGNWNRSRSPIFLSMAELWPVFLHSCFYSTIFVYFILNSLHIFTIWSFSWNSCFS